MARMNDIPKLTERELDVLHLMNKALSNREISDILCVSVETVRTHAKSLYRKLDVSSRQEAALRGRDLGLLGSPSADRSGESEDNLPARYENFIGRKTELNELSAILGRGERLVTLLGAGGMGKTRLALEYAYRNRHHYPDGTYFIPLDTITSTDSIILQIAECLSLSISNTSHPRRQLLDYLRSKQMLLVIDNWEHVLDKAVLLVEMLNAAPDLHVMATSRERLQLMQEVVYPLDGLSIPRSEYIDDALQYDAVRLLEQRAQQIQHDWQLNEDNQTVVYDLCQLTLGMPLAIILAVGWLDTFPLDRIVHEIRTNLEFLKSNVQDISERHRSLYAVFDWTWNRLPADEQRVFMKLSVFRNGFTFDAAESIAGATPLIIKSLVSKSLLYFGSGKRLMIHELLRQYSQEKLQEHPDDMAETRDHHADYFGGFAREIITTRLNAPEAEVELENLCAAWNWAVETLNMDWLWQNINVYGIVSHQLACHHTMINLYDDAIARFAQVEQQRAELLACIYYINAFIHLYLWDSQHIKRHVAQGRSLMAGIDWASERIEVIVAHVLLSRTLNTGDEGIQLANQAIAVLESHPRIQEPPYPIMLAYAYGIQSLNYYFTIQDQQQTQYWALRALELSRQIGQQTIIGLTTQILGAIDYFASHYEQASEYFREAEAVYRKLSPTYDFGIVLYYLGTSALELGQVEDARRYLYEAQSIFADYYPPSSITLKLICAVAAWQIAEGYALDATQLVAYCQQYEHVIRFINPIPPLLESLQHQLPSEVYQAAIDDGKQLTYADVIRDLNIWLED